MSGTDTNADPNAGDPGTSGQQADPAGTSQDQATLLSRISGLDAKVTAMGGQITTAIAERDAALQKLADYEAGKVNADEALRAQLVAEQARTAAAERAGRLGRIEGKYPEAFALLGDAAASMSDENLAAMEARLKGVVVEAGEEPPTPKAHNESKTTGQPKQGKEPTAADIKAQIEAFELGPEWRGISG